MRTEVESWVINRFLARAAGLILLSFVVMEKTGGELFMGDHSGVPSWSCHVENCHGTSRCKC